LPDAIDQLCQPGAVWRRDRFAEKQIGTVDRKEMAPDGGDIVVAQRTSQLLLKVVDGTYVLRRRGLEVAAQVGQQIEANVARRLG
jgi:hypothetical protein